MKPLMKRFFLSLVLLAGAPACLALAPYVRGAKLPAAELPAQVAAVEQKLQAAGFTVIGRHMPKGIPTNATIIVTDPGILDAIGKVGGSAISAAALRVGVQADGSVSYMNPEYWHRAFVRRKYGQVEAAVKASQARLTQALGEGAPFGGNVEADDLASYRYMFGMERFDSNSELVQHASFDEALASVRANLAKGTAQTARVYEVVLPERKVAVFGVAMNDTESGEGWWVNKIEGSAHVAALPYEIFIVDNTVYALYARFRIALAWPGLGMGQFMGIFNAPHVIHDTMSKVAAKP
ncbi:hypothetical protein [Rhodoferax sp. BAB1]|uniref:hypothetical protein n=1 Tax=Rhodoferax sp. BAB1 TaxID=2741720 RepID=UPI001C2D6375|nr:hypothetical protein [Rhodoferax sp. BAB1]